MSNEKPVALELADIFENLAHPTSTLHRAATELRRQHARIQELEAMLDAVGAGGVSAQRITQAKDHIEQDLKMVAVQEPFGYFKAEPFGWRDCADTDEGAIALYEVPQPQADGRVDALYTALEVCSAELFAQCAHQGRAMKYVEQARKALAAEQCARASIAAAKEI